MSCPTGSITTFPLILSETSNFNDIRSDLTVDSINLIFKWGTSFSYPNIQVLNEFSTEITHNSFNSTSLVYNYLNYKLINVQITKANFTQWISSPSTNPYDIVLTFIHEPVNGNNYDKNPQIVLLINPIIESTTIDNDFLKGLAGFDIQQSTNAISQKNISAEKLFENNSANNYAYYTTCINNNANSFGDFQNMLIVVNTGGTLLAKTATIERIKSIIESKNTRGIINYTPIYSNLIIDPTINSNIINFKQKVKLSKGYIIKEDIYVDTTDAYKCVPINPESDIDGSTIKNDSNSTSLKSVLDEREKEKKQYNDVFVTRMGLLTQVVTGIVSIIFTVAIGTIFLYLVRTQNLNNDPLVFRTEFKIFSYIAIALIIVIIGMIVGFLIGFITWKVPPPNPQEPSETPSETPPPPPPPPPSNNLMNFLAASSSPSGMPSS
jgi:hypothetical protein